MSCVDVIYSVPCLLKSLAPCYETILLDASMISKHTVQRNNSTIQDYMLCRNLCPWELYRRLLVAASRFSWYRNGLLHFPLSLISSCSETQHTIPLFPKVLTRRVLASHDMLGIFDCGCYVRLVLTVPVLLAVPSPPRSTSSLS